MKSLSVVSILSLFLSVCTLSGCNSEKSATAIQEMQMKIESLNNTIRTLSLKVESLENGDKDLLKEMAKYQSYGAPVSINGYLPNSNTVLFEDLDGKTAVNLFLVHLYNEANPGLNRTDLILFSIHDPKFSPSRPVQLIASSKANNVDQDISDVEYSVKQLGGLKFALQVKPKIANPGNNKVAGFYVPIFRK